MRENDRLILKIAILKYRIPLGGIAIAMGGGFSYFLCTAVHCCLPAQIKIEMSWDHPPEVIANHEPLIYFLSFGLLSGCAVMAGGSFLIGYFLLFRLNGRS